MIRFDETFDGTFPYSPYFTEAPGFRMHYVDEGPRDAQVVLCLHGEPTWGYLFRELIGALREDCRVVVPDHMGFGKSETPQDRSYWLQDHIDNLERFVLSLDLKNITLVMHDFGGPVGMGLAARHPNRIRRLVAINAPTPFGQDDLLARVTANAQVSPWFRWILKANIEGRLENVLNELSFNMLSTLKLNGFENHERIDDTWLRAYAERFASPADCAGALGWAKGFAIGAHRFEIPDEHAKRAITSRAALAIWGMADRTIDPKWLLPLFTDLFPAATVHRLVGVGHYSLEDAPEAVTERVVDFVRLE